MGLGMGFYMNKLFSKRVLTLALATLFVTSCLKKQDLDDPQVGPTLNADEVTQKMMSDVGVFALDEMKKGEYSSMLQTQTIEETNVKPLFQQDVYVDEVTTATNGDKSYDLLMNFIDRTDSSNSGYNIPFQILSSDDLRKPESPLILFYEFLQMSMFGCKQTGVTCHNLNVTNETFLLAPELAHESICSDKDHCEVRTKSINMDMLKTNSDGSKRKVNYTFVIAPQLPFLSRVLKYCQRSVVKANPRNYLQEICLNVTNFRVGTTTTTP